MKKYLLLAISALIMTATAHADEVDPIGSDDWKTLEVTVKQLDQRNLADSEDNRPYMDIYFGDQRATFDTSKVTKEQSITKKITIPKASSGDYKVYYRVGRSSYDSNDVVLLQGKIDEGSKKLEVRLKRIDVRHMNVTRPDGSTYTATSGDFSMQFLGDDSHKAFSYRNSSTNYGIDVPVGYKYKIHVESTTEDGMDSYNALLDFAGL